MPTYDYECSKCGHTFDAFQRMSDEPLTVCPACKKHALRRLIGGGMGVIFKGSGFYATDSRSSDSGKKKSEAVSSSGGASAGESAGGAAGESAGSSGTASGNDGASSTKTSTAAAASTGSDS